MIDHSVSPIQEDAVDGDSDGEEDGEEGQHSGLEIVEINK